MVYRLTDRIRGREVSKVNMVEKVVRGAIYYADLDAYGSEQGGRRPVVVVQNDTGNKFSPTTIVIPLTTAKNKRNIPTHGLLEANQFTGLRTDSIFLTEQVRVIDKSRLLYKVGHLTKSQMAKLNVAVAISLGLLSRTHESVA